MFSVANALPFVMHCFATMNFLHLSCFHLTYAGGYNMGPPLWFLLLLDSNLCQLSQQLVAEGTKSTHLRSRRLLFMVIQRKFSLKRPCPVLFSDTSSSKDCVASGLDAFLLPQHSSVIIHSEHWSINNAPHCRQHYWHCAAVSGKPLQFSEFHYWFALATVLADMMLHTCTYSFSSFLSTLIEPRQDLQVPLLPIRVQVAPCSAASLSNPHLRRTFQVQSLSEHFPQRVSAVQAHAVPHVQGMEMSIAVKRVTNCPGIRSGVCVFLFRVLASTILMNFSEAAGSKYLDCNICFVVCTIWPELQNCASFCDWSPHLHKLCCSLSIGSPCPWQQNSTNRKREGAEQWCSAACFNFVCLTTVVFT